MKYPTEENYFQANHVTLLESSFQQLLGRSLMTDRVDAKAFPEILFNASIAIVSHGIEGDPIFNYGNRLALTIFEMDWKEFTSIPSRLSAEQMNRDAREKILQKVSQFGFIDDYQGVRISKTGKRFLISNTVIWDLYDGENKYQGQAACFKNYVFLD